MEQVTIFTATFNREKLLSRLYNSLCSQTNKNFIWLIVDDGSTDKTKEYIKEWINEKKIRIKYYYQENSGKMAAHNYGVKLCKTELFFCVDSDDFLPSTAIDKIINHWNNYIPKKGINGILAFKGYHNGKLLTSIKNDNIKLCTLSDGYNKYGLSGDTALIFKTCVLKRYEFPIYENEKFIPEAYLYDLIDQTGKLILLREIVYFVEYQDDGYSTYIEKNLYKNPKGYFTFINQRLRFDKNKKNRFLDSSRYMALAIAHKKRKKISSAVYPLYAFLSFPIGLIIYKKRYKRIIKNEEN